MSHPRMSRRDLMRRSALAGALTLTPGVLLSACGDGAPAASNGNGNGNGEDVPDDTLAAVQEAGFIRVALANEPPYTEVTGDGEVTGAAIEVPRAVLAHMGIDEVDGVVVQYDAMIPGLQAGRFDLVTAGLFITPERCSEVIYSEPDVCGTESFLVPEGNPLGLTNYASLVENGAVVGVPGGSVEEEYAEDAGVEDIEIIPDSVSGVEAVQAGRIDAYALPSLSIQGLLESDPDGVEEVGPIDDVPVACAGAAFRPQDESFREAYNEALEAVKESGEFAEILESFGFPADVAMETTAEQLCETG